MVTTNKSAVEGYWNVVPKIETITFPSDKTFQVYLVDGRIITVPVERFPSIQQLTPEQRQQWYKFGNGFSFDDSDEIIHIEQILGNFDLYRHEQ